jgi:hypothetical protein
MDAAGYGYFSFHGNTMSAHRVSYELMTGPILNGLHVLHNCPGGDNPSCINPCHLWLGTPADNVADMIAKGRNAIGSRSWFAKLNEDKVVEIRARFQQGGITKTQLALDYGVSVATIRNLVFGRSWKHVS